MRMFLLRLWIKQTRCSAAVLLPSSVFLLMVLLTVIHIFLQSQTVLRLRQFRHLSLGVRAELSVK